MLTLTRPNFLITGTFTAWGALTRSQSEGSALPARPIKYHLEVVAKTQ